MFHIPCPPAPIRPIVTLLDGASAPSTDAGTRLNSPNPAPAARNPLRDTPTCF